MQKILGPVMLDLIGKTLADDERELLQHPLVGGVIIFTRNYASREQLKELIRSVRAVRPELIIGVDQEGGRVQRFREEFTRLPPLAEFGDLYRQEPKQALALANESAQLMASEISAVGIDFSFAPVLDVDQGLSTIIGDRSFSQQAEIVALLGRAYIAGMNAVGMAAVGKHFPGHGAVKEDSHKELPSDPRDFATIWDQDLLPYRSLQQHLNGILTAHIVFPNIDEKPASFSPFWLQKVLRQELQFQGAIFSDDLSMSGAEIIGDYVQRATLALQAGCDMVLICNQREAALQVLNKLKYKISAESQQRLLAMRCH